MSDHAVARRYAGALYELGRKSGTLTDIDSDMTLLADTLADSRDLRNVFSSPIVSRVKKKSIVSRLFGPKVNPLTRQFLDLLVDKGREHTLPAIASAYRTLRDEQEGIIEATARAAVALSPEDEARLKTALEQKTGKRIRLKVKKDDSLLGGLVVRVGDMVFDGSIQNSLAHLREQFGLDNVRKN